MFRPGRFNFQINVDNSRYSSNPLKAEDPLLWSIPFTLQYNPNYAADAAYSVSREENPDAVAAEKQLAELNEVTTTLERDCALGKSPGENSLDCHVSMRVKTKISTTQSQACQSVE